MPTITASDEISPYDRLYWPDEDLRRCLANGEQRRELTLYLGASGYAELAALARAAATTTPLANTPRVWLLPGIMGSQLGIPRQVDMPPDLIWLDPTDVIRGDLVKLRLTADTPVRALGLVHHSYLRLWLRLLAAGFDARPFTYDWRRDILEVGARLAQELRIDNRPAILVAHSLGGLIARAALRDCDASALVSKVIQLGVPNKGAAAALLALRGCYPVVQRAAQLDRHHNAEQLAREVFASFVSVQQLRPEAPDFWSALPPADARYQVIAGVDQVTCDASTGTGANTKFRYSRSGDGTVSLDSARLPNAPCYVTQTEHSDLARDPTVAATVIDLLKGEQSSRLPQVALGAAARAAVEAYRFVSTAELQLPAIDKINWGAWDSEQRRHFLEGLNAPLPVAALAGL